MGQWSHPATPWWLVPNLLALDAPVVAAVWQRFLGHRFGVAVPVAATVAFSTAVWCVYLLDRWLDGRRGAIDADRHRLAADYPLAFFLGVIITCGATVGLANQLPKGYVRDGIAVGVGVLAYLVVVHAMSFKFQLQRGFKELLVAVSFAAGVAIPLDVDSRAIDRWLPSVAAFGGICWLNCRLIDRWEFGESRFLTWPECLLGCVLLGSCFWLPPAIGAAIGLSWLGLAAIHLYRRHQPRASRVLADLVLLSPLVCWWMP